MTNFFTPRTFIRFMTFIGGIYFVVEFLLPDEVVKAIQFDRFHQEISYGFTVVSVVAVGLGLINLFMIHGARLAFLRRGWVYSAALLLGLFGMMGVTINHAVHTDADSKATENVRRLSDFALRIVTDVEENAAEVPLRRFREEKLLEAVAHETARVSQEMPTHPAVLFPADGVREAQYHRYLEDMKEALIAAQTAATELHPGQSEDFSQLRALSERLGQLAAAERNVRSMLYEMSMSQQLYAFLYYGLFVPLSSAMFALLGFYITSAAYRAFRVRSAESALMLTAAVVVILGQIPFGLWLWDGFPALRLWLLQVPSSAAFRAITIGASIAALVMAFRMWLSIESESFSQKAEKR